MNDPLIRDITRTLREQSRDGLPSDVLGSYTGTGVDYEQPVQDQDDL